MKAVLTLLLTLVFCISMLFLIQNVSAEDVFSDSYNKSDLVLVGKVLSLERAHNATIYEIQVEQYYKNPQSAKAIAVFGPAKGIYYMQDPTFEVDDRLFLYLEKRDGVWAIQSPSFKLQYYCDASVLVPSTFETYSHGMPASDDYPTFSEPDFIADIHKVGKKMQIKYTVHNYTPFINHATVTLLVNGTNQNKTVFSDQKTVIVPACNGSVPLEWNFTPQRADAYVVQAKVTSGYDTQRFLMIRDEPYVANSFQARENVSGGSIDKTVYPIIKSPLQQFKSGIEAKDIVCKKEPVYYELVMKKSNGQPICIKGTSVKTLTLRGYIPEYNGVLGGPIPTDDRIIDDRMIVDNKTYYFTTINETLNSAHGEGKKITFHDVTFTLFPRLKIMNLGGFCGSGSFGASILFADGTRESLKINIPETECMNKFTKADLIKLTNHTEPQAGLTFFDDGVRLLVNSDAINADANTTPEIPTYEILHGNDTFFVGEQITFQVKAREIQDRCSSPEYRIVNKHTGKTVWDVLSELYPCPPPREPQEIVEYVMSFPNENVKTPIINEAGDYILSLTYGTKSTSLEFSVVKKSS